MVQDLIRKGVLPKPKGPNDPKPSNLYMTFEELRQKNLDDDKRKFERMIDFAEKDLTSARIKWGPRSVVNARLAHIRASPERRSSLEVFIKEELPKVRRAENALHYKDDILARNRNCVSRLSHEKDAQKQREAARRSQRYLFAGSLVPTRSPPPRTHLRTHTHTHTSMHMHMHMHTHTHTHMITTTNTNLRMHTHTHTHAQMQIRTHARASTQCIMTQS